jgi:hypothetical protein
MSNEQPSRPRKSGSSASPMGSTLAIVIAIAAVVVGFLILKNIRSDKTTTSPTTTLPTSNTTPLTDNTTQTPVQTEPTTTVFTPITAGALVIVANSSHQNGVAKTLSSALQGQNFTMGTPVTGSTKEAATKIQYKSGDAVAQQVAQSIAVLMGVTAPIEVMGTPVALKDPTTLGDATVLVLLGDDRAGKTLAQMTGGATTPSSVATATT